MINYKKNMLFCFVFIFSMVRFCFGMEDSFEINLEPSEISLLRLAANNYEVFCYKSIVCGNVIENGIELVDDNRKKIGEAADQKESMRFARCFFNDWCEVVKCRYIQFIKDNDSRRNGSSAMCAEDVSFNAKVEIPELEIGKKVICPRKCFVISRDNFGVYRKREII